MRVREMSEAQQKATIHFVERSGEIFTMIRGSDSKYMISNKGRVLSLNSGLLTPGLGGRGYLTVSIRLNGVRQQSIAVHRLVAEHFVPGFAAGLHVDHIDRNKTNNRASNLRWVSPRMNSRNLSTQSTLGHNIQAEGTGFKVQFWVNGANKFVGTFPTLEEAIKRRDEFMLENHL